MKALQLICLCALVLLSNCTSKNEEVVNKQRMIEVLRTDENLRQILNLEASAVNETLKKLGNLDASDFAELRLAYEKRVAEPQKFAAAFKKHGFQNQFDDCFEKQKSLAVKFAKTYRDEFVNFSEAEQRYILREAIADVSKNLASTKNAREMGYCEDFCGGTVIAGSVEYIFAIVGCTINYPNYGDPWSNCFNNAMNSYANSTAIVGGGICAYCCIRESNCR
jgi:hypothetical protein